MALISASKKVHVRCSKETCKRRDVFDRHPDAYRIPRKCPACKGTRFRVIKDWAVERGDQTKCDCAGKVFAHLLAGERSASKPPHRRGSINCWFRKDGSRRMPGDADFSDPDYDHDTYTTEQEDQITQG